MHSFPKFNIGDILVLESSIYKIEKIYPEIIDGLYGPIFAYQMTNIRDGSIKIIHELFLKEITQEMVDFWNVMYRD